MNAFVLIATMSVLTGIGRALGMGESAIFLGLAPLWLLFLFFLSVSVYFIRKTGMMEHLRHR